MPRCNVLPLFVELNSNRAMCDIEMFCKFVSEAGRASFLKKKLG